ncbi:MAG: trigger factor [Patescibacteria group bacterium]|nr:trigger factor [Patescibacteria group bacterium]
MKVEKKILEKSQIEFVVELPYEELKTFVARAAEEIAKEIKIDGFRPGKAPLDMVKKKVGEMSILEKAANLAINKSFANILEENAKDDKIIGQPMVDILKLAPENPLEFKIVLSILPAVTLGEYKNLGVKATEAKIDEKEVGRVLDYLRETRVKEAAVDREVKDGDKVVANINMYLDSVPVEGGQTQSATVIIGKEYFVPGFDGKIIGAKKGEVKEFSLPYPKDFHQKNLAGKNVEFKVELKDIFERIVPEMDDELAKNFGGKDLADLKAMIEKDILGQKSSEAERKTELDMLEKVLAKTKFGELPEMLVSNETEKMLIELEENISRQGGKMEDYLSSLKKSRNQLALDLLPEAVKRVKTALLIREIGELEKIAPTENDVEEKIKQLLEQYKGYAKVEERVKDPGYRAYLKNSLASQKVVEKLKEWNVVDRDKK